ncbi:unnamed protein product, partial [Nesidiocoris tenuis]
MNSHHNVNITFTKHWNGNVSRHCISIGYVSRGVQSDSAIKIPNEPEHVHQE